MSIPIERTFILPAEHAAFVDDHVASGAYASEDEVVQAALQALRDREVDIERWLRDEVGPAYDAVRADPARVLSARSVFDHIWTRHAARITERT